MSPRQDQGGAGRKKRTRSHPHGAPGAAPGTLVIDPNAPRPVIRVFAFGPDRFTETTVSSPDDVLQYLGKWPVTWVNVDGLGDAATLQRLGQIFGLHQLALEDVVGVHQRAKIETYTGHLFVVVRMVSLNERVDTEQVSLFLGSNFVLTFQERTGDCLDPVRNRIRTEGARVRTCGADYLAYALLDAVIDAYYPILESFGERLDDLQDTVVDQPEQKTVLSIQEAKLNLRVLRRTVWPLRELFNSLCRDPLPLVTDETRVYLRDCYDHTVQVIDLVETYREVCSDLSDVYLSSVSNRMNEIMKVLTIIATIFIPLTFIAGVYGMNFNPERSPWNMPELNWRLGYPFAWLLMVVSAVAMLFFFRHKGWLGGRKGRGG